MFVNHETNPKAESREQEIDQEIEALKESHPFITKEEYWSALKRAMIGYDQFKEKFTSKTSLDDSESDKVFLDEEARSSLARLILDCQPRYSPRLELIAESLDDSSYLFLPTTRPTFTEEANPVFAAEKYGVPKILPVAVMLSKDSWTEAFPHDQYFDEQQEDFCSNIDGINRRGYCFSGDNILSTLGLNVIYSGLDNSLILQSFQHENIHMIDFLLDKRSGINLLIAEFIAHRINSKTTKPKKRKSGHNPLDWFLKNGYVYAERMHLSAGEAGRAVGRLEKAASQADDVLDFSVTTQLLLNCETVDEFVDSVQERIKEESIK